MKKFLHYGKEITVQWGEESFVYTLKRKGVIRGTAYHRSGNERLLCS